MGPTGLINSSVDEMASYARMMLAGGSFAGSVSCSKQTCNHMQPCRQRSLFPDVFGFQIAGWGCSLQTYRGIEIASHGNLKAPAR
jgi:hypothetical protein